MSDEIVFEIIGETLRRDPATSGFVLDGFPRTIAQADALDVELAKLGRSLSAAILLDVPDTLLIRRLSGRRICTEQGHEYHLEFRPPSRAGTCDLDGSLLVRRDDDEPLTIRRRLAVYHDQTEPLIAHYDAADRLRRIDGMGRASEIRLRLAAAIRAPSQSSL